jgi:arylsulfatase A
MPHSAIVQGNYKLIHFYESPHVPMLFDLSTDRGEVHNIASVHPDLHGRLMKDMMQYFDNVGARMPKQNPNYDAVIYKKFEGLREPHAMGSFYQQQAISGR